MAVIDVPLMEELKEALSYSNDGNIAGAVVKIAKLLIDPDIPEDVHTPLRTAYNVHEVLLKDCINAVEAIRISNTRLQNYPKVASENVTDTEYVATLFATLHLVSKYIANYGRLGLADIEFCIDCLYNDSPLPTMSKLEAIIYGIPCTAAPRNNEEFCEDIKAYRAGVIKNIHDLGTLLHTDIVCGPTNNLSAHDIMVISDEITIYNKFLKLCAKYLEEE